MSSKPLISFDYAIKYLLKDKKEYEIIEGFISAVLGTCGYKPVKIHSLLESESTKEQAAMKKSIADLVVEDEDGNKYVVEIERSYTNNFLHKALFNTSRIVVDNISGSQDYTDIKKVFHISLLYFAAQNMEKPIYHGKTIIHEIDTKHPTEVKIANQGLVTFEKHNIFPEYFVILVPQFKNIINSEMDEWLYVMKNSEVYKEFKSPYMSKVQERLNVLKMDEAERNEYYHYLKKAVDAEDTLNAAEQKGMEKGLAQGIEKGLEKGMEKGLEKGLAQGREEGIEKANIENAKRMIILGADLNFISQATTLSLETVKSLASKIENHE